jgi:hypothetical protein
MQARFSFETLTPKYTKTWPHNPKKHIFNENIDASRLAVYTIREGVTYRTTLIKAMSLNGVR